MSFDLDDTIVAIATAPGGALRGIVRISGPDCVRVVESLVAWDQVGQQASAHQGKPRCQRVTLNLPRGLGEVPVTLYLWPTSSSYTRQPSAELHLPGSPPVLAAALVAVCQAGARLARPGEFTMRAFLAGRLDLTQAEAVLGVIDAASARELDAALSQLAGGLARPLAQLREQLLDLLAQLEAGLDFVEEDIEFISAEQLDRQLAAAADLIGELVKQMSSRGEAGRLPRIVLMGLPNVGKSSLLNALAGQDAAIVSEIAGTTRDFVTRRMRCGGRECLITDTAGWASADGGNSLEMAAQTTAKVQIEQADVILLCLDSSRPLSAWEMGAIEKSDRGNRLVVGTKCDLPAASTADSAGLAIRTSSRTGEGINDLCQAIGGALERPISEDGVVAGTADRCRESLRLASEAVARARAANSNSAGEELVAAEVRVALDELGRVVGAIYTEDILDRVFSRFCIGK